MGNGFRLARLAGIDVYLDWSLLIIFALVAVSLGGGAFPAWHPDWAAGTAWATALAAAVLFLASVLVHEMSHALVGRLFGIEIPRITLFVFGGMAQMREEPKAWRPELLMAIAGPLTSAALGFAFVGLAWASAGPLHLGSGEDARAVAAALGPWPTLLLWLGPINIVLAIFNMVPGFPLDGGRVLRAIIWGATGNLHRATQWAAFCGQLIAWLLIASGFAMALGLRVPWFGTGLFSGLWLALIGWFLNNAAAQSYRQLLIRETLADVPVARLMKRGADSVAPTISVHDLVERHVLPGEQRAFAVVERGGLVGLVSLRDVHKLPRSEWEATAVREIMTPAAELAVVAPGDSAANALALLSERQVNQLPVVEHGEVRGLLRREDVLRWLSLYADRNASA